MGTFSHIKEQQHYYSGLTKKFLPWTIYALLFVALFRLYFYPSLPQAPQTHHPQTISINIQSPPPPLSSISSSSLPSSPPPSYPPPKEQERVNDSPSCDYTNGKWVQDKVGPLYNDTSCGAIKQGRNCISHGRPDKDYLFWRWKPRQCKLPRFDPNTFLTLFKNKHLAFVGDSLARNQAESLMCMLASASSPELVYDHGEDNKFRRWNFASYNVNLSIYWSPFLVEGIEKEDNGPIKYNRLFLDRVHDRWAADMDDIDMIVFSVGHWFLHPAVYYEGDIPLGCHVCSGLNLNHSEIGFYGVFGKAINTTLKAIIDRRGASGNEKGMNVIVTTFSPAHFEGEWDKFGACSKTKPYKESEKNLEGMDEEMRRAEVEEVERAKEIAKNLGKLRIEALDVTKLALLRPDAHPGPYMYPFPFANGVKDRVQNDCVHWCLPGPIDTWNEIMLDIMKRWNSQSRRGDQ